MSASKLLSKLHGLDQDKLLVRRDPIELATNLARGNQESSWGSRFWDKLGPEPVAIRPDEQVLLAKHHHWIVPMKEMGRISLEVLAMAVLSFILDLLPIALIWFQLLLWTCTIGHSCWTSRHIIQWRAGLLIVSDRRLIRTGGIFTQGFKTYKFDTVNNYYRTSTVIGRMLGYCTVRIVQQGGVHNEGASDEYIQFVPIKVAKVLDVFCG